MTEAEKGEERAAGKRRGERGEDQMKSAVWRIIALLSNFLIDIIALLSNFLSTRLTIANPQTPSSTPLSGSITGRHQR